MPNLFTQLFCLTLVAYSFQINAGDLTGRLSAAAGDYFLAGVEVIVNGTTYRTFTDPNGLYRIIGLPAGEYTVIINYMDANSLSNTVSVSLDGITRLNATLRPPGGIDEEILVIDGFSETDGLDVTSTPLPGFPQGLLVIQDGRNVEPVENQKIIYISWGTFCRRWRSPAKIPVKDAYLRMVCSTRSPSKNTT